MLARKFANAAINQRVDVLVETGTKLLMLQVHVRVLSLVRSCLRLFYCFIVATELNL